MGTKMTADNTREWKLASSNLMDDATGTHIDVYHSSELPIIWNVPTSLLDQLRRDAINSQRENLIAEAHTQFMYDVDKEVHKAKKELLDEIIKIRDEADKADDSSDAWYIISEQLDKLRAKTLGEQSK